MNLRYLILHNFWLKLISLGLASLIWLAVHYQIQSDHAQTVQPRISHMVSKQYLSVPVSIITKPGDSRVFEYLPQRSSCHCGRRGRYSQKNAF